MEPKYGRWQNPARASDLHAGGQKWQLSSIKRGRALEGGLIVLGFVVVVFYFFSFRGSVHYHDREGA